jgi:hypothetical protein
MSTTNPHHEPLTEASSQIADLAPTSRSGARSPRRMRRVLASALAVATLGTAVGVAAGGTEHADAATWLACDGAAEARIGRDARGNVFTRAQFGCQHGTAVGWYRLWYRRHQTDSWGTTGWLMTNRRVTEADGSTLARRIENYGCSGYDFVVDAYGGYFDSNWQAHTIDGTFDRSGLLSC